MHRRAQLGGTNTEADTSCRWIPSYYAFWSSSARGSCSSLPISSSFADPSGLGLSSISSLLRGKTKGAYLLHELDSYDSAAAGSLRYL